jgi:hypothetical protein
MTARLRCLSVLVSLAFSCNALAATAYHGFQIDDAAQRLAPDVMASLGGQLDIVETVGLPPKVLEALKQTPIVVDPDLRGNPGVFAIRGGVGVVYVRPIIFPSNKPILLHELLHAYHYNVLTMRNRQIENTYRRVKDSDLFPARFQSAHFLQNAKEFFAVTGTLYLFGDIQQPPFSCHALAKLGDDYLAFLAAQFGPHECHSRSTEGQGTQ